MKNKFITIVTFLLLQSVFYGQPFYYTINLKENIFSKDAHLFVSYEMGSNKFVDSFKLNNKIQTFKGKINQPVSAIIYSSDNVIKEINVFLANNTINIFKEINFIKVIDKSRMQKDYLFLTKNDRIRQQYFPLYGELNEKNDTTGLVKLSKIFDSLRIDDIAKAKKYLETNKNVTLSLFSFMRFASFSADYAASEPYFFKLPKWAKESADGLNIAKKISSSKTVQLNTVAPSIESKNLTGEVINAKEYSGKYIFLDFWASWCGPCRKEHPELKNLYNKFRDKNFQIISISLDEKKDNWRYAVEKDSLSWINISELKGFQAKAALDYGVQSIPANFLINTEGIIIAKNSTPAELEIILKKILQ
jgi:thiol-disulfide isomerase/thioredoxin